MNRTLFLKGIRHGMPIALGYLSVSFAFGIQAVGLGMTPMQAVLISMTNVTSAGQLAGIEQIARGMSIPMAGIVPYDENIHAGNNMGNPVVLASDSYIAKNFSSIALRVF